MEEPTGAELQIIGEKTGKVLSYKDPLRLFADTQCLCGKDQNKGDTLVSKPTVSVSLKFTTTRLREGCMEMKEERERSGLRIMSRREHKM